jgi:hypothetical protein
VQLRYRLNKWVSFAQETTYLDTLADSGLPASRMKLFRGVPARTAHAWRNEFGPVFTF